MLFRSAALARFEAAFARHAAATVAPNVVILLVATPDVLEERVAFRMRRPPPQTDLFADVAPGSTALCQAPPETVAMLVRLQERLAGRLRGPSGNGVPKATVVIDSGDLGQATLEAIAAVEAMA